MFHHLRFGIILSALLGVQAIALEVRDPQNLLGASDTFLGDVPFATAFQCGDSAKYLAQECDYTCDENGCTETCKSAVGTDTITKCSETEVTGTSVSEGREPGEWTVTKAEYDQTHGNFLRYLLVSSEGMPLPGVHSFLKGRALLEQDYVTLDSGASIEYTTESGQRIAGMQIQMTFNIYDQETKRYFSFPVTTSLGKDVPAVGQLLEMVFTGTPVGSKLLSVHR